MDWEWSTKGHKFTAAPGFEVERLNLLPLCKPLCRLDLVGCYEHDDGNPDAGRGYLGGVSATDPRKEHP
jgi:hypothetical protein